METKSRYEIIADLEEKKKKLIIPKQLQNPEFRFYRINPNSKFPKDKSWNNKNCFHFNHSMIKYWKGNYGIACGYGNLLIIDFDDRKFYESIKHKLPKTFVVISAGKRLPHYYYYLKRADTMKKIAIKDDNNKTLCDLQTKGTGIVGPNSAINGRYYDPNDNEIAEITFDYLKVIFDLDNLQKYNEFDESKSLPELKCNNNRKVAYAALYLADVKLSKYHNMRCPFHEMNGAGNLSITPQGKIYCFNCGVNLWPDEFLKKYFKVSWYTAKKMIFMIRDIYNIKK